MIGERGLGVAIWTVSAVDGLDLVKISKKTALIGRFKKAMIGGG